MTKRLHIVGAGPGGLASAMLLAQAGLDVHVYEKMARVGGRTTTWTAEDYQFDLGPTFFLYPRVLEEIFALCGRDLHTEIPMVRLDTQYRVAFGDGTHLDCTSDPERMAAAIASIEPEDAPGFARFMEENRSKLADFRPVLEREFDSWKDLLSREVLSVLPNLRPWNSIDRDLRRYFSDWRVRLAFCFQSKYLGMSPFRCPSLFTILSHLEYEHGVWHPLGGHGAVTEAMGRVASELGVTFHLGEGVDEVLYEGDRAVGVRTRNGVHKADAVIVNADFARAMKTIVPEPKRPTWSDKRIDKTAFSCSTFMLYLGIEGEYDLPHHTIHIPTTYEDHLVDIEKRHVLSDQPSMYVQNACVTDPGQAPKGHSTLYVLVPVSQQHDSIDWDVEGPRYRELVLDRLESEMGLEGIRDRIRFERVVTPKEWDTSYDVHLGAVFNMRHNITQMLHLRPHNRFDDGEGMYLVGGGTHPGSGLPVIFESARISSRLVLQDLGVAFDWAVPEPAPATPRLGKSA